MIGNRHSRRRHGWQRRTASTGKVRELHSLRRTDSTVDRLMGLLMARPWRLEDVIFVREHEAAFGWHNLDIDRAYPWRFISSYMRRVGLGTTYVYGAFSDSLFVKSRAAFWEDSLVPIRIHGS